jgi:hypothetical protein
MHHLICPYVLHIHHAWKFPSFNTLKYFVWIFTVLVSRWITVRMAIKCKNRTESPPPPHPYPNDYIHQALHADCPSPYTRPIVVAGSTVMDGDIKVFFAQFWRNFGVPSYVTVAQSRHCVAAPANNSILGLSLYMPCLHCYAKTRTIVLTGHILKRRIYGPKVKFWISCLYIWNSPPPPPSGFIVSFAHIHIHRTSLLYI